MAPDRRATLFLLAAATLVAIAATLALVLRSANDGAQRAHRARAETGPVVLRSEAATELPAPRHGATAILRNAQAEPEREDLPVGVRPRARAERTTRRVERAGARVRRRAACGGRWASSGAAARRSFRATATRRLARFVLSARPRVPAATAGSG